MRLFSVSLFALDTQRDIHQFAHRSWGEKDGFPGGALALAQTTDGFLWIGGDEGLFRFDGVHIERYNTGYAAPIGSLLALPDGSLWIGYNGGDIWVLRNGKIKRNPRPPGVQTSIVYRIVQDHEGTMWANTDVGLIRLNGGQWERVGTQWNFPQALRAASQALFVDSHGTLWAGIGSTVVYLKQGSKRFEPTGVFAGDVTSIAEAPDGTIWMADINSAVRVISTSVSASSAAAVRCEVGATALTARCLNEGQLEIPVKANRLLFDRNGSLWLTTQSNGLRRVPYPSHLKDRSGSGFGDGVQSFGASDGLSADNCVPILEDREGNIWVATRDGLDQLRETKLVPVNFPTSIKEIGIAPADGGDIWVTGNFNSVARIHGNSMKVPLTSADAYTAYRDNTGVTWLLGSEGLQRWEGGRFQKVANAPEGLSGTQDYMQVVSDNSGTLWAFAKGLGFLTLDHHRWKAWPTPPEVAKLWPTVALCDGTGRIWVSTYTGEVVTLDKGKIVTHSRDQLELKGTPILFAQRGSRLWITGGDGFILFENGQFHHIRPAGVGFWEKKRVNQDFWGHPLGLVDAGNNGLWLSLNDVVVHVRKEEIERALKDPSYHFQSEYFDSTDGLPGKVQLTEPVPKVIQGTDERIWFSAQRGVAWIDLKRISRNTIPPPVSITSVSADIISHRQLDDLRLPAHTANVQINYSVLSLSVPEKVQIRYKLDGIDKDWQDPGTRREALYSRLPPGHYQFHVIACNNDGVWNKVGATLSFAVAPAWFQTIWFEFLVAVAALALVWMAYTLRLRQVTARIRERLGTRMEERERIARELHDTLLQSFQGLTLHFQRARNLLPDRTAEAIQTLDTALDGAEEAIVEGRDAIHDLRSSTTAAQALAEEITALGEQLAAESGNKKAGIEFRIVIEGSARPMRPNLHIEIFRIAREAMRNAFGHSQGHLIETEMAYTESLFRLRVRDDGKGIDPDERVRAERTGHWGLMGMRERAGHLGGELEMWSEPGAGTEIELTVPASIAYEAVRSQDSSWKFWRRKTNP